MVAFHTYMHACMHIIGGKAISEALFLSTEDSAPSGRLPFTYPKHAADVPYPYHRKTNGK